MHIDTVYLGTYRQSDPIKGHFTIKDEGFSQTFQFSVDEAAQIQEIISQALDRHRAEAAAKLLSADVRVPQLEAPKTDHDSLDGDFTEVEPS